MSVIIILILASLGVAVAFLGGFIWAVRSGQYEDTLTPSLRVLTEESPKNFCKAEDKSAPVPVLHQPKAAQQ